MPRALLVALLLAAPAAAQDRTVKGKVVDADGKPVAGAEVANFWNATPAGVKPFNPATTAADGTFAVKVPGWMAEAGLLAFTPDRSRGGLTLVDPKSADPATIKLGPAVTVSGTFDCTELGRRPKWTNVYMNAGAKNIRVIQCSSDKGEFAFPLPPGDYQFWGYGEDVLDAKKPVTVPADRSTLDLGAIDLKAAAIAKMVGKSPTPWQATDARGLPKTVKIEDLKGKWVLVDFWGHWCGPCIRGLAEMIDFYELHKDHRDKFEIVAFHDSSVADLAEMDKKLVPIKQAQWAGRDLPFPVLLDTPLKDDKGRERGKTATAYTITKWPTTVLIDPDGKVVGEVNGVEELEKKLPPLPPGVMAGRALDKMLGLGVDDMSLTEFAKFVGQQARVEVTLDEAALKAKGLDPAAKQPFKMSGQVSARSWFDLMLSGTGLVIKPADGKLLVTAGDPLPPSKPQVSCDKHLAEVLAKPLDFDLPAGPLADLCQFFEQKSQENFVLDPAARRAGTLKPDTAVPAAKSGGKPLAEELKAILDPLGLEAVARCEVIVVRPKAKG